VLAVIGVVVGFSLSSTLVKRADTPGVLIAMWRMVAVSVLWNLLLWRTHRRVTRADVRQVWLPGVFFGLTLAVLFGGVTQNSIANAALIGALSPFLIVPIGAWLFGEYFSWPAISFAVVAFGGVALVLLSAPVGGDASLAGNVFAVIAMLLMVAYVTSARQFRRELDVTRFMATICPIAAVAVLPIALAHGGMFELSTRGWVYTAILTLTSGMTAQGLLIYAQKSIQIGTIGTAQQVQPALAIVWSFLLLGEVINARQAVGIAIVVAGLTAFVVAQARGSRSSGALATTSRPGIER
jgi:drug/metabolite transporter (DMT)-like permease